jgi:LacI family transcriptional regulator
MVYGRDERKTAGLKSSMTVHEIADLAGVSIGTVDRVIHKRGRVSAATKARIEAIITQYQFTPNLIASRLKRGRTCRFCVVLPRRDQDAGYWTQAIEGIERGADEVKPLGVETEIIEYDRYTFATAQAKIRLALSKKPDGMIFAPVGLIKSLLSEVREKQIPYIFFDSDFPEMTPLCTISQDPAKGGYLAGRLMHLFAGAVTKPVAVLDAHSKDYHIIRRREGFLRYAGEQRFSATVKEYSEEQELSEQEIRSFLKKNPDLTGIFVTNCFAHRVAQTVKNSRIRRNFFIIGYDLIPDNKVLLQEGFIDAIISQRPEEQCRQAVVNLYRHIILEEKIPLKIEIPLDIYIKENIPFLNF